MSSGGGSKSYTRLDLASITKAIETMTRELQEYRSMLASGGSERFRIKSILHIYG